MSYRIANFEKAVCEAPRLPRERLSLEEKSYETEHGILVKWFEQNEGNWGAGFVRIAGLAIYGWMPTILRAEGRGLKRRNVDFSEIAKELNSGSIDPKHHNFLNGSYIGTSKFLHFWRPDGFAIWDRNIHKALDLSGAVNAKANFEDYQHDICEYRDQHGGDLRDIEFRLFCAGRGKDK